MAVRDLYETDFVAWTEDQAARLRDLKGDPRLDAEHLAEEVADLGRSELARVSSLVRNTLVHLLKLALEPDSPAAAHWVEEALAFQNDALLALSPGMRQRIDMERLWRQACKQARQALAQQGVTVPRLPDACPVALDTLLDEDFDAGQAVEHVRKAIQGFQPANLTGGL